jgi:hypothetical protein
MIMILTPLCFLFIFLRRILLYLSVVCSHSVIPSFIMHLYPSHSCLFFLRISISYLLTMRSLLTINISFFVYKSYSILFVGKLEFVNVFAVHIFKCSIILSYLRLTMSIYRYDGSVMKLFWIARTSTPLGNF